MSMAFLFRQLSAPILLLFLATDPSSAVPHPNENDVTTIFQKQSLLERGNPQCPHTPCADSFGYPRDSLCQANACDAWTCHFNKDTSDRTEGWYCSRPIEEHRQLLEQGRTFCYDIECSDAWGRPLDSICANHHGCGEWTCKYLSQTGYYCFGLPAEFDGYDSSDPTK